MRTAVLVPALNEESALPLVLAALDPKRVDRVVVVDNGSEDRTAEVARSAGAVVVFEPRRGYGAACLAGLDRLGDDPPDVVVFLDGDHSDYPEDLPLLLDPISNGDADMVLGERVTLAEPKSLMPQQRLGNALATWLIAQVSGHTYRDMGPFRAIRWSCLQSLGMSDSTWGWNVEMQLKAVAANLRIREVAVRYRPRIGTSKISGTLLGTLRAGTRILWAVWHYRGPRS